MRKIIWLIAVLALLTSCDNKKQQNNVSTENSTAHSSWVYDATIYEVNVRQFTPEGTFNAMGEQLPRLKELGVDILWFMPIQPIGELERKGTLGSYYSISDYKGVNPEFGTFEDFKNLVSKAHEAGFKIILDWVANHTSRDNIWLKDHADWYMRDSLGNIPVLYDWTDIGEVNYDNLEMRAEMIQSMLYWIKKADIDGFRCDVASEVPTDFWQTAKDSLKTYKQDIFMLAEAEKPELNESVFDAYYAWDFHHKMNLVAQGKENVDSLRSSLNRMQEKFSKSAIPMYFTSNHDENSWNGTEFERMGDAARSFAALTYVLPGMPLTYNGQEAGFNRRLQFFEKDSIDWNDNGGFGTFYKSLNDLKKGNPALKTQELGGEMIEITNDKPQSVWSFMRVKDNNTVVCVFNFSKELQTVEFTDELPEKGFISLGNESVEPTKKMELKPWEYKIFYKN
ncbi:MAG: alpha-amylase family glycosyl hydrolase [Dysgonamonadaceae bacterium]|nr:alpha-amylase family glycosyl hydrolase [Dysgonamonadaceae bacterium]